MGNHASSSTRKIEKFYTLGNKIGEPGAFGYAVRAVRKSDGATVAVKVIAKKVEMEMEALRAEMKVMGELDHPNIINGIDYFETKSKVYIVMELCTGGELFEAIVSQAKQHHSERAYSEADCASILKQLFQGLQHMHEKKIAHCDLKPSNFLFKTEENKVVKIIDFGMARHTRGDQPLHSVCGTWHYMAPEVFDGSYTFYCDMWSMGVVMFVMLFGFLPFHGRKDHDIRRAIRRGFSATTKPGKGAWYPEAIPISESAKDLLARLLEKDPTMRFTCAEALDHPFLNGGASDVPIVMDLARNLTELTQHTKLQVVVLKALADIFSDVEVETLRQTFADMDTNNDGEVSTEEAIKLFSSHPEYKLNTDLQSHVEMLMANADLNHNGTVDWTEMMAAATHHKLVAKEERLRRTFDQIDLDGDGKIGSSDLINALGFEADEVAQVLSEADLNEDGVLTYDEFRVLFINQSLELRPGRHGSPLRGKSTPSEAQ